MAALKIIVDKIEDVDEAARPLYVQREDGKFSLPLEGYEDPEKLKKAINVEREAVAKATARAKELDKKIKDYEKLGKSAEEIEELVKAQAAAEEERLNRAGEWTKLKDQMNAKHQEELKVRDAKVDAKDQEIVAMRKALERNLIDAQATAAIAAHKGVPDLLLPFVQRHVKVVQDGDNYFVRVVDTKGDPRVDGKGDPLTIDALVAEMKGTDILGRAFEGSGQSGSGMRPNAGGGRPAGGPTKRSDFKSEKERSAWIDANGLEEYQKLPLS
jgi:hypothetical protein